MVKRWVVIALVLAVAGVGTGACSSGDDESSGDRGGRGASSTTSTSVLRVPSISFSETAAPMVDLGDGWEVGHCEGEAPIICVSRNGEHAGIIELSPFPVSSFHTLAGFRAAIERGDEEAALQLVVDDFLPTLQADRKDGCGADYVLDASPTSDATVLGRPGVRYGYVARKGKGPVVERQISHATIIGDEVLLVNAAGYADDGCVPREGEFTPEQLNEFDRYLPGLVAVATR
ncbi:MAG TPA: hypothetical protein VM345_08850 [Acidimicrobiales bacterium]|nr:hypothetical protein [Acidimicrobiales bacterium]